MNTATLTEKTVNNHGIACEWAFCAYCGIDRTAHDAGAYDKDSDVNAFGHGYSVKSSGATLMSGSLCEGLTEFEDIWDLYVSRVHSDRFVYVTNNWTAYIMDLAEFGEFIHEFGRCERESAKNGGAVKIRLRKESSKMLAWLESHAGDAMPGPAGEQDSLAGQAVA